MGKTTLSIHLADALALRGSRVLLIDAYPQQSAMKWSAFRAGENKFSVIAVAKPTLHKELTPIYTDYTDIVILHRYGDRRAASHPRASEVHHPGRRRDPHPRAALAAGRVGDRRYR
jgi:cellulose biosynthesis protein BcsQ